MNVGSVGPKIIIGIRRPHNLSSNHLWIVIGHCHLIQAANLTVLKVSIYCVTNLALMQLLLAFEQKLQPLRRLS